MEQVRWRLVALALAVIMLIAIAWSSLQHVLPSESAAEHRSSAFTGSDQGIQKIKQLALRDDRNFTTLVRLEATVDTDLGLIPELHKAFKAACNNALNGSAEGQSSQECLNAAELTLLSVGYSLGTGKNLSDEIQGNLNQILVDQRDIVNEIRAMVSDGAASANESDAGRTGRVEEQFQMGWRKILAIAALLAATAGVVLGLAIWVRGRPTRKPDELRSKQQPTKSERSSMLTEVKPQVLLKVAAPPTQGFLIEATASAGPRKSVAEYDDPENFTPEFSEDSTGIVTYGSGYQLWWLSDGTTPRDYQPAVGDHAGLSTRMLARDIGDCFVHHLDKDAIDTRLAQAKMFDALRCLWQERLDGYLAALKATNQLEAFKGGCPQNADGSFVLKWSTTFLGGILIDRAQQSDLQIFYAGDSGGLVFFRDGNSIAAEVIEPNSERIFVQAILRDDLATVRVIVPNDAMRVVTFEDVEGFVALSDGAIKADLGKFLFGLRNVAARRSIEEIRQGLISRSDKSYDDKSMVFGRKVRA